ncbi:hypothetical protein KP509_27G028500 [Ceratopteris richardii]|uniref:Uncharacterized protein n=1 Tax=Ceratopteris richardii TaxID=49495 RepID=A0A8T2RGJ1_CERRI|nr:hypothetical protein KP509_27G028500 [Ceratopteris richardii]
MSDTWIKTREQNIAGPLDPASFADAIVQIHLERGGDLELIAKDIQDSDLIFQDMVKPSLSEPPWNTFIIM